MLVRRGAVSDSEMPFTVRAKTFYANSELMENNAAGFAPVKTTAGIGAGFWWRELPRETAMDRVDQPSAIVEIATPQGSLGTFLVSAMLAQPQQFTYDNHTYEMLLRPERFYLPFSLTLLQFHHDKYPGTDIPKNFSSRVRLQNLDTRENREVLIYMNNPLRYQGETFYQASYDPDDGGSILQVVHNPSWLTPYLSCVMVAMGLTWQFLSHLIPFLKRRMAVPGALASRRQAVLLKETLAGGTPPLLERRKKDHEKVDSTHLGRRVGGLGFVRHSPAARNRFSNPRIRQAARADGRPLPAV